MKMQRMIMAIVPLLVVGLMAFAPSILGAPTVQAARPSPLQDVPITGQIVGGGTFQGTLDIVSFSSEASQMFANGLLTGTLTDPTGGKRQVTNEYVTVPVSLTGNEAAAVTCSILHLTLGPLDLNLLGLQVHLDRVVLDITAQGGPGNLVGNLLCAIAHLLDTGSPLDQIVGLLNRIIDLLN